MYTGSQRHIYSSDGSQLKSSKATVSTKSSLRAPPSCQVSFICLLVAKSLALDSHHEPNARLLNESLLLHLLYYCKNLQVGRFEVRESVQLLSQLMGWSGSLLSVPAEAIRTL